MPRIRLRNKENFSWLAVVIGAVAFYFLGAAWYTFLFRKPWLSDMGIDPKVQRQAPMASMLIVSGVAALVVAMVIEYLVRNAGLEWGLRIGALFGTAMAVIVAQNAYYDVRPKRLALINGGYPLVGGLLVGVIAGLL